jgi:hypothetical protein
LLRFATGVVATFGGTQGVGATIRGVAGGGLPALCILAMLRVLACLRLATLRVLAMLRVATLRLRTLGLHGLRVIGLVRLVGLLLLALAAVLVLVVLRLVVLLARAGDRRGEARGHGKADGGGEDGIAVRAGHVAPLPCGDFGWTQLAAVALNAF